MRTTSDHHDHRSIEPGRVYQGWRSLIIDSNHQALGFRHETPHKRRQVHCLGLPAMIVGAVGDDPHAPFAHHRANRGFKGKNVSLAQLDYIHLIDITVI
jgi:hypothetical protein